MAKAGSNIPQPVPGQVRKFSQGKERPYVRILEQPASKLLRFRYESESKSAGSLLGVSSSPQNKTFPTIQVVGYKGRAFVVVSCVTKDEPFRPHPHGLVGRDCKRGLCTVEIPADTMTIQFPNLGIQCVKRNNIGAVLEMRKEMRVDPYHTGFDHMKDVSSIDPDWVRLCFQVFLEGDVKGKFNIPLAPVVSTPILDKKAVTDLKIVELSDCVSYVDDEKKKIILLCEKIAKDDIQIRFYEEKDDAEIWEGFGEFRPSRIHKLVAIPFTPPRYHNMDILEPVRVFIQLRRPSDGAVSKSLPFEFLPSRGTKRKRFKFNMPLKSEDPSTKNKGEWPPNGNNFHLDRMQTVDENRNVSINDVGYFQNDSLLPTLLNTSNLELVQNQYVERLSSASAVPTTQVWQNVAGPSSQYTKPIDNCVHNSVPQFEPNAEISTFHTLKPIKITTHGLPPFVELASQIKNTGSPSQCHFLPTPQLEQPNNLSSSRDLPSLPLEVWESIEQDPALMDMASTSTDPTPSSNVWPDTNQKFIQSSNIISFNNHLMEVTSQNWNICEVVDPGNRNFPLEEVKMESNDLGDLSNDQNRELKQINLISGELGSFSDVHDMFALSENLSISLSL